MKLHAFAAFMALSLVGLTASAAKADYPCCGDDGYDHQSFVTRSFEVIKHATVFGCDGYHCETNVVLKSGIRIKARCRNGWCELRDIPMKNVWVLKSCLEKSGYSHERAERKYDDHYDQDDRSHYDKGRYSRKGGYDDKFDDDYGSYDDGKRGYGSDYRRY